MTTELGLRINEIFFSLQGEANTSGAPTVFIRLTGCPLRCQYCDTAYAFHKGQRMPLSAILAAVAEYPAHYVTVTGGEPLAQPESLPLMQQLCDKGYAVSLETSGAMDISNVDERVSRVLDIKTPGSLECDKNLLSNVTALNAHDQVKFVICDRADYDWSKQFLAEHTIPEGCSVWFSPSYEQLRARDLADWIVEDGLAVRFQLQLHKYLWGDVAGK